MLSLCFLIFVGISCVAALQNWRWGMLLGVVIGILQDPVRKVTPGCPTYILLLILPVYASAVFSLVSRQHAVPVFFRHYPRTMPLFLLLLASLAASSLGMLRYGIQTAPLVALGWFSYVGGLPAVLLGFFFVRKDFRELEKPLIFMGAVVSLMLIGVPLEYAHVNLGGPWLGMVNTPEEWRHWYSKTEWVAMLSGFFRSPEIMGWHAATLVMISLYLLIRRPAFAPLWLAQAGWGLTCVLFSGRRKMFLVILVFLCLFALLGRGRRQNWLLASLLIAGLLLALGMGYFMDETYMEAALSGFTSAAPRLTGHAYSGPLWLLGIVGPFGYGVGAKSQGAHLLADLGIDTPLVEGGFEKVLVELGFVGVVVILLCVAVIGWLVVKEIQNPSLAEKNLISMAALAAFLGGNLLTFLVAFQVYGDPLIGILLGFSLGLILSGARMAAPRRTRESWRRNASPVLPQLSRESVP